MGIYVVERYLPGWTTTDWDDLLGRLAAAAAWLHERGVVHVHSLVLTDDETCLSVFDGPDAEVVARANRDAGLPTDRIVAGELTLG